MEGALEDRFPKYWRRTWFVFIYTILERGARPFWACHYSMSFSFICKGQTMGKTVYNFFQMSFIKDIENMALYNAFSSLTIPTFV